MSQETKVRYGPSPTGIPHIGNIRTALFNYLFAKNQKGKFYLRIEDTDQNRIVEGAVEKIKESLSLLGLNWDDEIIFQSKRKDIYKKHLDILKEKELAYEDEGAWRFKIKTDLEKIAWIDVVHGEVSFPANVLEDFIIMKSDGYPTYHFASVVDDHLMQISHVFRGDEWISSTPKHLLLYQAFGWEPPKFVHLPVILGHDKKKLSKREGAKSVMEYLKEGYLAEALVNFLALLGWSPKDEQEVFSIDELSNEFSLDRINKNNPIFNSEKLDWFNGQWLKKLDDSELAKRIQIDYRDYELDKIKQIVPIVKDRINKISDFEEIAKFFFKEPDLTANIKEIKLSKKVMTEILENLEKIDDWNKDKIAAVVDGVMEKEKLTKAQVYRSVGISVSGSLITPPIFPSLEILGKNETIERLKNATKAIKE